MRMQGTEIHYSLAKARKGKQRGRTLERKSWFFQKLEN
jgi:hypothetical protein